MSLYKLNFRILKFSLFSFLFSLFLASGCLKTERPTEPTTSTAYLPADSPENVLHNLQLAYNEKNLEKYLECLSDSLIYDGGSAGVWGKEGEKKIHKKMFNESKEINLSLSDYKTSDDYVFVNYSLQVSKEDEEVLTASGSTQFQFDLKTDKSYQITTWIEKINNKKLDISSIYTRLGSSQNDSCYCDMYIGLGNKPFLDGKKLELSPPTNDYPDSVLIVPGDTLKWYEEYDGGFKFGECCYFDTTLVCFPYYCDTLYTNSPNTSVYVGLIVDAIDNCGYSSSHLYAYGGSDTVDVSTTGMNIHPTTFRRLATDEFGGHGCGETSYPPCCALLRVRIFSTAEVILYYNGKVSYSKIVFPDITVCGGSCGSSAIELMLWSKIKTLYH